MTFTMKVFLLGLGLGAMVAMTSAACDKAGGCKVPDDDVSFMQLSVVQGNQALAKTNSASQPGDEMPQVCRAEAWKTGWTTEEHKCYNPKFFSHDVEGKDHVMQGPLYDSEICNSQSGRFAPQCKDKEFFDPTSQKLTAEVTSLKAYTGKYRREKVASKTAVDDWNPEDVAMYLPFPFDDLAKNQPLKAQIWETRYLEKWEFWPEGAKANPGAHWYEVPLNYGNNDLDTQTIGRLYSTRVPRDIGNFDEGFESEFTPYTARGEDGFRTSIKYSDLSKDGVHGSDALTFQANKELKKVDVVVSLIIDEDLRDKAFKSKGGDVVKGLYGHHELGPRGANSEGLWKYYRKLGLTVLRCPLNDFNTPNTREFVECIERIAVYIAEGKNVVVHCFGGSGRTGAVMLGVAKTFGVPDVIKWGRTAPGKDTYLDVHEQELFVDQMPRVNTDYMKENMPEGVRATIDNRFAHAEQEAEKTGNLARCLTEGSGGDWQPSGEKIPMQNKCWMFGNCRGCMGEGDGRPGSYPPILQEHIHEPLGDERAPAPLSPEGESWYNYWLNEAFYFAPHVHDPLEEAPFFNGVSEGH